MATSENLQTLIENIFADDKIDSLQLKEFLKLISHRINYNLYENIDTETVIPEDECEEHEEMVQAEYLAELITNCEQRLLKLAETPKTKIVIRNEGQKLQSIIDSLECVKCTNCRQQAQIDSLATAQAKLKKLECERRQKYQDMIDRLYNESIKSDVCRLLKMFYGVQEQVDQLIVKCDTMQKDIQSIQEKIVILGIIPELEEKVNTLLEWRAAVKEDFILFVERYEHVKTVKASKCEVDILLEKKVNYCDLSKYVQKTSFEVAKVDFVSEFDQMKELFCELQLFLCDKLVALNKDLQAVMLKLDSKRRLEKRS